MTQEEKRDMEFLYQQLQTIEHKQDTAKIKEIAKKYKLKGLI